MPKNYIYPVVMPLADYQKLKSKGGIQYNTATKAEIVKAENKLILDGVVEGSVLGINLIGLITTSIRPSKMSSEAQSRLINIEKLRVQNTPGIFYGNAAKNYGDKAWHLNIPKNSINMKDVKIFNTEGELIHTPLWIQSKETGTVWKSAEERKNVSSIPNKDIFTYIISPVPPEMVLTKGVLDIGLATTDLKQAERLAVLFKKSSWSDRLDEIKPKNVADFILKNIPDDDIYLIEPDAIFMEPDTSSMEPDTSSMEPDTSSMEFPNVREVHRNNIKKLREMHHNIIELNHHSMVLLKQIEQLQENNSNLPGYLSMFQKALEKKDKKLPELIKQLDQTASDLIMLNQQYKAALVTTLEKMNIDLPTVMSLCEDALNKCSINISLKNVAPRYLANMTPDRFRELFADKIKTLQGSTAILEKENYAALMGARDGFTNNDSKHPFEKRLADYRQALLTYVQELELTPKEFLASSKTFLDERVALHSEDYWILELKPEVLEKLSPEFFAGILPEVFDLATLKRSYKVGVEDYRYELSLGLTKYYASAGATKDDVSNKLATLTKQVNNEFVIQRMGTLIQGIILKEKESKALFNILEPVRTAILQEMGHKYKSVPKEQFSESLSTILNAKNRKDPDGVFEDLLKIQKTIGIQIGKFVEDEFEMIEKEKLNIEDFEILGDIDSKLNVIDVVVQDPKDKNPGKEEDDFPAPSM